MQSRVTEQCINLNLSVSVFLSQPDRTDSCLLQQDYSSPHQPFLLDDLIPAARRVLISSFFRLFPSLILLAFSHPFSLFFFCDIVTRRHFFLFVFVCFLFFFPFPFLFLFVSLFLLFNFVVVLLDIYFLGLESSEMAVSWRSLILRIGERCQEYGSHADAEDHIVSHSYIHISKSQ